MSSCPVAVQRRRLASSIDGAQYADDYRKARPGCGARLPIRSAYRTRSGHVVRSSGGEQQLNDACLSPLEKKQRSKDGVVLSVNQEISGDRQKYEIIGKYDLIIKSIASNDSGRYLCQNFDQALSMTIELNVLSKWPRRHRRRRRRNKRRSCNREETNTTLIPHVHMSCEDQTKYELSHVCARASRVDFDFKARIHVSSLEGDSEHFQFSI